MLEDLDAYLNGDTVLADRSGHLRLVRLLPRESRHTEVLAQWGRVWMAHGILAFLVLLGASVLRWSGTVTYAPYALVLLSAVLSLVVPVWYFRFRGGKPLTTIEKQLGQVIAITACAVGLTVLINLLKGMRPMELLPVAALEIGISFGCFAAILGGSFYVMAFACAVVALLLTVAPDLGPVVFGAVLGGGLFMTGWRVSRQPQPPVKGAGHK